MQVAGSTRSEITHLFTQDVDPQEDEAVTWTEEQLRDYFSSGGEIRPERRDTSVAGGFRDLPPPPPTCFPENMPKIGDNVPVVEEKNSEYHKKS